MMHLCNLFDYAVIAPEDYYKSIQKLQKLLSNYDEGRKVIIEAREQQLDYWDTIGSKKQIQLLEQQKKIQESAKGPTTAGEKPTTPTKTTTEKTNKKETKSKHEDEKLHTAVVNLKNSKNSVTNSTNRKREAVQNKEDKVIIKRRRSTLRGNEATVFFCLEKIH